MPEILDNNRPITMVKKLISYITKIGKGTLGQGIRGRHRKGLENAVKPQNGTNVGNKKGLENAVKPQNGTNVGNKNELRPSSANTEKLDIVSKLCAQLCTLGCCMCMAGGWIMLCFIAEVVHWHGFSRHDYGYSKETCTISESGFVDDVCCDGDVTRLSWCAREDRFPCAIVVAEVNGRNVMLYDDYSSLNYTTKTATEAGCSYFHCNGSSSYETRTSDAKNFQKKYDLDDKVTCYVKDNHALVTGRGGFYFGGSTFGALLMISGAVVMLLQCCCIMILSIKHQVTHAHRRHPDTKGDALHKGSSEPDLMKIVRL